ncbi:MAG: pirin family protein [Gammaproteobacteria bacterium]|nr:pirin family protein [Gammaproteobacteria bacterium]
MIILRKSQARGHANHGWLDSYHTFSFAGYYDPAHMGFSSLRVINDDRIAPGAGFGTHGHNDMEIITYVLDGALEHKDSMGNGSVIFPGDVQRMSAGTGITHSEYNASKTEPAHLLQIWILPNQTGVTPSYEQTHFSEADKRGRLRLIASPDGRDGSVKIYQDASVYATVLSAGESVSHALMAGRKAYVHVARGEAQFNGQPLAAGDGARVIDEHSISFTTGSKAEILLFDLD